MCDCVIWQRQAWDAVQPSRREGHPSMQRTPGSMRTVRVRRRVCLACIGAGDGIRTRDQELGKPKNEVETLGPAWLLNDLCAAPSVSKQRQWPAGCDSYHPSTTLVDRSVERRTTTLREASHAQSIREKQRRTQLRVEDRPHPLSCLVARSTNRRFGTHGLCVESRITIG